MTPPRKKWKFAIGTTSQVPGSKLHYLIVDVDAPDVWPTLRYLINIGCRNLFTQRTKRGWHIYTDATFTWRKLLTWLPRVANVDKQWVKIGARRGYLFLADKDAVVLPWPVKRMVIYHAKGSNG